jgi:hypothetical protein
MPGFPSKKTDLHCTCMAPPTLTPAAPKSQNETLPASIFLRTKPKANQAKPVTRDQGRRRVPLTWVPPPLSRRAHSSSVRHRRPGGRRPATGDGLEAVPRAQATLLPVGSTTPSLLTAFTSPAPPRTRLLPHRRQGRPCSAPAQMAFLFSRKHKTCSVVAQQ